MSDGPELDDAVDDLDEEGWNQRGTVHRSTFARLSATNALITEEILEVSLGNLTQQEVLQRATEIELRTNKCWDELPEFLRLDISAPWSSQRSPLETLYLVFIIMNHLDHHFLLQRTLSKKVHVGSTTPNINLLKACSDIFNLVAALVENKDHYRDFQIDFVQVLVKHGIPAAAVLAVELLHQERCPTSPSALAYPLHRSDTIQSLSVFVFVPWKRQTRCQRAAKLRSRPQVHQEDTGYDPWIRSFCDSESTDCREPERSDVWGTTLATRQRR
jgi:hypothetical protein